ncbi:uncharacterized protein LOC125055730 [Pieris napi]|uniref:uncharacterized protein LOC125055730 n=1 Tax=Pieris napi TaxID=78633 RepID=UPI001FBA2001|nr:uncharacterized protein LOC125055730 [Pieris napi]
MAPQRKVSMKQLDIMVKYFESHKHLVGKSRTQTIANNMIAQEKWLAVSKILNAVKGGAVRTPEQWRRYFTEWTSKCRKKANNALKSGEKKMTLNDIEIRLLQIVGNMGVKVSPKSSSASSETDNLKEDYSMDIKTEYSEVELVFAEDYNTEEIRNNSNCNKQTDAEVKDINLHEQQNEKSYVTPPPQWALDLEERRVTSQERMADALQSIASTLRSQEQRRILHDKKIANSLTVITDKIQELTSGIQFVLQDIEECKHAIKKIPQ